ncbi:hypothetical protein [Archangium lansingense]|uniref:Lipoprotein n=1 Tax=Archangium lansingense TaxID=2995310 RepID=A0ABT4AFA1_9BACT|nr:hypothetical protein [Archangium lansinium]MCY1080305.1 hypothetical protein [Archangium lansinium]
MAYRVFAMVTVLGIACGGTGVAVSSVDVVLRNTTQREAAFYLSGGGREATLDVYEMHYLLPGDVVHVPDAMAGPRGARLFLGVVIAGGGLQMREYQGEVTVTAPHHVCILALSEMDYAYEVSQECSP